jgi:hypothetical protein
MQRTFLVLLGASSLTFPSPSFAAIMIDSFESGPFSVVRTSSGTSNSVQNPNPAHCIANQRTVLLHWNGGLGTQMSATLSPLQSVDDSVIITLDGAANGDVIFEYSGGPWDLTQAGVNDIVGVSVGFEPADPFAYAFLDLTVRDDDGDSDTVRAYVSVSGRYRFPFSEFDGGVDFQAIDKITLFASLGYDVTLDIRYLSATNGAEFALLYQVWQPTAFYSCDPGRSGGGNALAWNWGILPSNPQIMAGSQMLVTGVGGPNCASVTFQASNSGGPGQPGDMAHVTVDWAGSSFDQGIFEMHYTTDPNAPFVATLLGDPVVEFWDSGFVIRHQVHAGDVPNAPDGTATQELVVTPYPGQQLSFDYVEALSLSIDQGGYSLGFGVSAAEFDPDLPLLEMYATGTYEDDAGVTSVIAPESDAAHGATLRCDPTVSRTISTFALDRPSPVASSIEVYDVTGRLVRSLSLPAEARTVAWDGRSTSGTTVGAGVYLARWSAPDRESATARVVRLR